MVAGLKVLVSGCSIAGPSAAYWLRRRGNAVTVVERSDRLRTAGQNIDVRGSGREVLRRMQLEDIALANTTGELGIRFVDDSGAVLLELPAGSSDSDGMTAGLEVLRGRLSRILLDALPDDVDVVFGRQITKLESAGRGAHVTFDDDSDECFDLVVVAEGARSRTRQLVFGDVPVKALGLYTAYGSIPRADDDDRWWNWFNATGGRSVTLRPDNTGSTRVALSFLSPPTGLEGLPLARQRSMLVAKYEDVGWKVPRVLRGLATSDELYVDYLTQVSAPDYARGPVVLLGDAAWCPTPLSGMGTTLALTGAYVLAGELASNGTLDAALARYRRRMSAYVEPARSLPPGGPRLVHPRTRTGLAMLRLALGIGGTKPVRALANRIPARSDRGQDLPGYPELQV